jgi:hypothetical protein
MKATGPGVLTSCVRANGGTPWDRCCVSRPLRQSVGSHRSRST